MGNEPVLQRFAAQSVRSLLLQITATGLGFISVTLMARWLGASEYGRYTYILTWIGVIAKLISALFDRLLVRQTAYYDAQNTPALTRGLFQTALTFTTISTLGLVVLSAAFGLTQNIDTLWLIAIPSLPFTALLSHFSSFMQGHRRVISAQIPEFFILPALWLACIVGLYYSCQSKHIVFSAEWAAAGNLATIFITWVVSLLLIQPNWRPLSSLKPQYDFMGWWKSGGWFLGASALFLLNSRADLLLLGYFDKAETVGIYKIAVTLSEFLKLPLIAVNAVLMPQIARYWAENDLLGLQKLIKYSARLSTLLAIIAFVGLLGIMPWLLHFYGKAYEQSYSAAIVLGIAQLINVASGSVGNILNMTKHDRDVFYVLAISTSTNLLLGIWLIPTMGYIGAAYSSAISTVLWNLILVFLVRRRLRLNSTVF